jgi:hypothetical protein
MSDGRACVQWENGYGIVLMVERSMSPVTIVEGHEYIIEFTFRFFFFGGMASSRCCIYACIVQF